MDYGEVITNAWRITWNNKFLWVLGFLAALTSGGNNSNSFNYSFNENDFVDPAQAAQMSAMILALVCVFMIIGLVLWLLSVAARGGLVDGVNRIDDGEKVSLGQAFSAGKKSIWRIIGVYLLTYLPLILMGIVAAIMFAFSIGGAVATASLMESPDELLAGGFGILGLCMCLLLCAIIPISIVLYYIAEFGIRGTVINQMGITDSISHGWQVLKENVGPVILLSLLLFVISIMVSIVLGMILLPVSLVVFGPAIFTAVSGGSFGEVNIAWTIAGGLLLGVFGAALMSVYQTWHSAVWTLAYKEFTGKKPEAIPVEKLA